jgi:predicted Zn finger-like uncharacterized protein
MRITCPSCHATYEVPAALLGAEARKVRCARCACEWSPEAMAPPPAAPEPPAPRPRPEPRVERPLRADPLPPPEREPPPSLRARSRPAPVLATVAAIAVSVVVLAALGWAAFAWRAEVMHVFPASQRLFAALGLRS